MTDHTDILDELMAIAIPITATDRSRAQTFAKQQLTQARAEQVYRNTIAILLTHRCLQLLGIKSDLELSDSWNPLHRLLENVADLYVPAVEGRLECWTIRLGEHKFLVPQNSSGERIGYVVVQLDDLYRQGQVLGFVPSVSVAELSLSDLQPLDALIDRLCPVRLEGWLLQQFGQGWEPWESLPLSFSNLFRNRNSDLKTPDPTRRQVEQLYLRHANLGLTRRSMPVPESQAAMVQLIQMTQDDEIRWQAAELLWQLNAQHPACPVISAKDLGLYLEGHKVAFMAGVLAKADGTRLILLRLYPLETELHLPPGLQLIGLDESGKPLFQVEARQQDDYIQFKFTADVGDRFTVRLVLNDAAFSESFVV